MERSGDRLKAKKLAAYDDHFQTVIRQVLDMLRLALSISLASKVISDQVPVEHVRDKKNHAKNIEREAGSFRGRPQVVAANPG